MTASNSFPLAGVCSLRALPEPYQTAFRQGSAHHLPGRFLPAKVDWFIQILLLPFAVMYALPILALGFSFLYQAIRKPASYLRFGQTIVQQDLPALGVTLLLFLLAGVLIVYCAYQAWEQAQSFYRTWHCSRLRRRAAAGYGVVLLSHVMAARLIDNLGRHNCLWLPKASIVDIVWQRMREEGAKRSRWVERTRICYVSADGEHRWLTLKGDIVDLGYFAHEMKRDRALYEALIDWWGGRSPQ